MNRSLPITLFALALALFSHQSRVLACSAPGPAPFKDVLAETVSTAIIRVEEIRLRHKGPRTITIGADVEAEVRVTETLSGKPAVVKLLSYLSSWCGGHNLKVGDYYVLLLRENRATVELLPNDASILYLFGSYDEESGSTESPSRLLMHLRNYERIHSFPDTFPVQKYFEHNFVGSLVEPSA
jgi:hypothetical protein